MKLILCLLVGIGLTCTALSQSYSDMAYAVGIDVHVFNNLHGSGVSFVDLGKPFQEKSLIKP